MARRRRKGAPPPLGTSTGARPVWVGTGSDTISARAITPDDAFRRNRGVTRRLGVSPSHWAIPMVAVCTAGLTWGLARQGWVGLLPTPDDTADRLAASPTPTTTRPAPSSTSDPGAGRATDADPADTTSSTAAPDTSPSASAGGSGPAATTGPTRSPISPTTPRPTPVPTTGSPSRPTQPVTTTAPTTKPPASGIFIGSIESTPYGPVLMIAVVSSGRLVDVRFDTYPSGDRVSLATSYLSLPALRDRSVAAQSAQVDAVSQATYTSKAYSASLQSALDLAGFR